MYLRYMTAHVRVNTSITCYAGYFAVHLLRKYTTMLGFLPRYKKELPARSDRKFIHFLKLSVFTAPDSVTVHRMSRLRYPENHLKYLRLPV